MAAPVPPAAAPQPSQDAYAAANEAESEGDSDETVEVRSARGPGRPRKGWTLYVNCTPIRQPGGKRATKVILLSSVLRDVAATLVGLAQQQGKKTASGEPVQSFYDIPVFERRDTIMANGESIAEGFGTDDVVADGVSTAQSDMKTLLDAVRPFASKEVQVLGA